MYVPLFSKSRFEVLIAMLIKICVFWDIMPSLLLLVTDVLEENNASMTSVTI